ncbi:MAG: ACP S-malonyltransferase [Acidobacteria bacterium]|nr:ACP S-malonyltransferase [Acidobacteriota bacterium]
MLAPVLLFPGQGAEAVGMSRGWERVDEWAAALEEAEGHCGQPLRAWMASGPEEELRAQRHAPNAVIAHSVGVYRAHRARGLALPAAAAGHSAGYFSALVAAGAVSLPAVLDLIRHTEDLADARFPPGSMGMAFVVGLSPGELDLQLGALPALARSNINGRASFTASGPAEDLDLLVERCQALGARAGRLPVRQPLHGPHMTPLLPDLSRRLAGIRPAPPRFPLCSGRDGRLILEGGEAWEEAIASVALPVDWIRVVAGLASFGGEWLECGPGASLARLTRWLDRQRAVRSLDPPE